MDNDEFKIRAYGKSELALLYFPDAMPHVATAHLMSWINRNKQLKEDLQKAGLTKGARYFTPKQVRLIIDYLGSPG